MPTTLPPKWLTWFLKIFFNLLYNQFAWFYDLVSWIVSAGLWKNWIRAVVPFLKGTKILELGHGPGHLQQAINDNGYSPFGIDISKNMGRICKRRLGRLNYEAKLVHGTASRLPYPSSYFDQIAATFPTEYIIQADTLKEIFRALAPGGELIILPEARFSGEGLIHKAAAWLFKVTGQSHEEGDDSIYQAGEKLFKDTGFDTHKIHIHLPTSKLIIFKAVKS